MKNICRNSNKNHFNKQNQIIFKSGTAKIAKNVRTYFELKKPESTSFIGNLLHVDVQYLHKTLDLKDFLRVPPFHRRVSEDFYFQS
jgi:hypothetical protein